MGAVLTEFSPSDNGTAAWRVDSDYGKLGNYDVGSRWMLPRKCCGAVRMQEGKEQVAHPVVSRRKGLAGDDEVAAQTMAVSSSAMAFPVLWAFYARTFPPRG